MAAILLADRVQDTSTTTGTDNFTLAGSPPTGFQSFNAAFGTGVYFNYCIEAGSEWEVGIGHLSASTTLVRDTVTASSNSGSAVSFSAGIKKVFCTLSAQHANQVIKLQKASSVTKTTDTTLADDADLKFTMLANKSYWVKLWVHWYFDPACDFKYAVVAPVRSGSGTGYKRVYSAIAGSSETHALGIETSSTPITHTAFSHGYIHMEGFHPVGGSGGTFAFQFAQNASHATDTAVIFAGSYLKYSQLN